MSRLLSRSIRSRIFVVAALVSFAVVSAWSASYKVLYNFSSNNARPSTGLVFDAQGNAYGATSEGGVKNSGTVYELSPTTGYHLLHAFGPKDPGGNSPMGNLVLDAAGNLYGATAFGGSTTHGCTQKGCGTVFELSPPSNGVGQWIETVLYTFCSKANCSDGASPQSGVIFDSVGNLYGSTNAGGNPGGGTIFELVPASAGWAESVLYNFGSAQGDGSGPLGSLVFDVLGNLYGATITGGGPADAGTVFELSPSPSGWIESVLHAFDVEDGFNPMGGVALDTAGNLYGTTDQGGTSSCFGTDGCGTVFELSGSDGSWTETVLHSFSGGSDGQSPQAGVVLDPVGNVYGTTTRGGNPRGCSSLGCGTVFRLSPGPGGQWTETLFRFPGSGTLGGVPVAPATLDSVGNVYGTTSEGGANGVGVTFRIEQ